jgi:UDPglucose 6-dehydrogenase
LNISVVGIGNVGLPFTAVASRYHKVVGIDINKEWVNKIESELPITEPLLNEYLKKYPFKKTTDFRYIEDADLIFIIVGSQKEAYSVDSIISCMELVNPYLTKKNQTLVIVSTIKPGSLKKRILPFLESKKVLDRIKGVCYNPVFVALGSAVKYFEDPNYVIIGESNSEAGNSVETFYRDYARGNTIKFYRTSLENAEVFKFALNLTLINKICLLNTLTEFCEKYGAHIDFIAEVLKEDPRIAGKKMFKGGLGYGGPCFPVDARSFKLCQIEENLDTSLIDAIMKNNERQVERTVHLIKKINKKNVSILGVTYKPTVDLTTESQAIEIIKHISKIKNVMIYDPRGMENAKKELKDTVKYARTLKESLEFGELILITVEWPQFSSISKEDLIGEKIIIDPWRLLEKKDLSTKYIPFGIGLMQDTENKEN